MIDRLMRTAAWRSDFDWQLAILQEVLGARRPAEELTNAYVARMLQVSESGVTQRRNGSTPLRTGDASKIIAGYELGAHDLDHRLFSITDPETFLETLKRHGVGEYEQNPRRRMLQVLNARAADEGLSVALRRARNDRGVGFATDPQPVPGILHSGEPVEIVVQAAVGRHVAILQYMVDMVHAIEVLSPSDGIPIIEVSDRLFRLPGPGTGALKIRGPSGRYRMMLVEADADTVTLFGGASNARNDTDRLDVEISGPGRMTDESARDVVQRIDALPLGDIRTATTDFIVI
ncbi:hypothetical protein [Pseudogemmobacter humi]|uniref:Uncharacterized protein n=1 Tax=Pseudogemmobacter humi TaxID=2483812 RepID=A0A3P5WPL0_9RHOB|nr:hypothetical protein [Pseudogemmobacter humi]VDC22922.1 hypothetical protein XINFAN_00864 [Pseudogemmobacter humi]